MAIRKSAVAGDISLHNDRVAISGTVEPSASSIGRLLKGFSRRGRDIARLYMPFAAASASRSAGNGERLAAYARALRSSRGEASGVALASDLLSTYAMSAPDERIAFLLHLAAEFDPDPVAIQRAWDDYAKDGVSALPALVMAVEAPRQELFRRLNLAPGGTEALVRMRADLLDAMAGEPTLARVDADLVHLLQSWFNRGFLTMQELNWSSPASLLERIIRYEAVHDIQGWDDLRRRLDPADRRCYAFFHPSLPGEPLIFVEVALTTDIADSIQAILSADRTPIAAGQATTAIFYSISNCQRGLRGISFGHFLIKQVAEDLRRDLPGLTCFATLSPMPTFRKHVARSAPELDTKVQGMEAAIIEGGEATEEIRATLLYAAVSYFMDAKSPSGEPLDPVARFHLGNGARLERLNWRADISANGVRQSAGMMVNYLYDLDRIEENHENYAQRGAIAVGTPFRRLADRITGNVRKMENDI